MYGLLLESIAEFAKRLYGTAVWDQVRKRAKIDNVAFSSHHQYSETLFNKIMKTLADITDQDKNVLMEMLGVEFVDFVSQFGYDRILRVLGRHMRDFLNGLDNLHEYMRFSYQKLKPPSFFVEKETDTGLTLHYRSKRKGYVYYVKGQIRQVAKIFYNIDVNIDVISEELEGDLTHVVYQLNFQNDQFSKAKSMVSMSSIRRASQFVDQQLPIKSEIFFELFPFHVVFNESMTIISLGEGLGRAMTHCQGESIKDIFNLVRPMVSFSWDNIISHTNNVFELSTIEPITRTEDHLTHMKISSKFASSTEDSADQCLKLKGQMLFIKEWDCIIFLGTPVLENLDTMFQTGFYINDLSMHDSSRDLVLVGTQQSAELKLALDQEKHKGKALEDSLKKLDTEMKKTDQLLYQMIPKKIADRLRGGEAVMNLCEVVSSVTILFSDVVGFTKTCSLLAPMEVVSMLNSMYTKFDRALEKHDVYKVETIGDAYMVVSGLPERTNNHAHNIVDMAFDMLNAIATLPNPATGEPMKIRVGCHSGPVVAGVVGLKMPRYCLFGDTVNTASRMESTSEAMKIHISHSTTSLLNTNRYHIVERGKLEVKGKGEMKTYFVLNLKDNNGNVLKCPFQDVLDEYQKKNPHKIMMDSGPKDKNEQKFVATEHIVVAATRDPLPPIRKASATSVGKNSISNISCLADLDDLDNDEPTSKYVDTSRKDYLKIDNKHKLLERDSTLLSIVTQSIKPLCDSTSQKSDDSNMSGLNPILAEFIKSEKETPTKPNLDFRRDSITDFRILNLRDKNIEELDRDSQLSEMHSLKSVTTLNKFKKNKNSKDFYSSFCNLL